MSWVLRFVACSAATLTWLIVTEQPRNDTGTLWMWTLGTAMLATGAALVWPSPRES